ncbi:MAG: M61 family peptidase, partial [Vulcanococcus sp.]
MVDVHLDLLDPTSQLVGVCLRLRPRFRQLRLQLPGWTPGSYLIRDYVRHLEALELRQGGESIALRRLGPACWQASIEQDGPDLEI